MTDRAITPTELFPRGPASGAMGLIELLKPRKAQAALPAPAFLEAADAADDGKPLIELRNVSKTFGATKALSDLEVSIRPGELVTVVGPSGCGKSTLFNILRSGRA